MQQSPKPTPALHVRLSPSRITWVLGLTALLLVLVSTAGQLTKHLVHHEGAYGLIDQFYLDREANLPSFFSAMLLLFAALLLAAIATLAKKAQMPYRLQWALLALLFLYLALDEACELHEWLTGPTRRLLGDRVAGLGHAAWVIPALAIALVFTLLCVMFFFHLPARTRLLFVTAAVLLVSGGVGVEVASGLYAASHGRNGLTYVLLVTLEESAEMAGAVVFDYALLCYLAEQYRGFYLWLGEPR